MNNIENVSRRGFLKGAFAAGALVLAPAVGPEIAWAKAAADPQPLVTQIFLRFASDGTVTIVAHPLRDGLGEPHRASAGGGRRTGRRLAKVIIEQAIGDPKYGDQDTDGSHSVRSFFDLMRQVGATGARC